MIKKLANLCSRKVSKTLLIQGIKGFTQVMMEE